MPTKKPRLLGKRSRGSSGNTARTTTDVEKIPFAKKLVMVIWTPKYFRGNVGHAALKLKRTNQDGELERIDYISWWPSGGGKGIVTTRKGARQNYVEDQYSELDKAVRIAIFTSYIYRAYANIDTGDPPVLSERLRKATLPPLLRNLWRKYEEGSGIKKRWRAMGFTDNFANMGDMITAGRLGLKPGRTRLMKGSTLRKQDGSFDMAALEMDGIGFASERNARWAEEHASAIGRYPDKKIYLPCAHLKTINGHTGHLPVWGLSLDLIRISWVIFRESRDPKWKMMTNTLNCASVVWNRMLEGFMDAFVRPKGSASTLGTAIIDPNDAAAMGASLEQALKRANQQQEQLFKLADDNFAAVKQVMQQHEIDQPGNWRKLLQLTFWKEISKRGRHRRPQGIRVIDSIVARYERHRKKINRNEERRVVEALLLDEKKFVDLKAKHLAAKSKVRQLEGSETPVPKKLGIARKQRDIRDSQEETTRAYMIANFDHLKGPRLGMARELVKLLNAVNKCAQSLNANNPRRPKVILLGLAAGWAFYEAAHLGEYIDFAASQDDHSFLCVTVRQGIHYSGSIIEATDQAKKDLADNMEVVLTNIELDEGSW